MNTLLRVIVVVWLSVQGSIASATMILQSPDPKRHDRFYSGDDKAFIGEGYDWSGVGRVVGETTTRGWATMVSRHYFLSAAHFYPLDNTTLRFYQEDNTASYEDHTVVSGEPIAGSDLWLGKLAEDEPFEMHIASYPILRLADNSDYDDRIIYTFGRSNSTPQETNVRLGRNNIDPGSIDLRTEGESPDDVTGMSFLFDYDESDGVGADESFLQRYDSGGPSFIIFNEESPALVGIHWSIDPDAKVSTDTFVPAYVAEINEAMEGEQLTIVPEPSGLVMLLGVGVGCLLWQRRPAASRAVRR